MPPSSNPKLIESTHISSIFFFSTRLQKTGPCSRCTHTRRNHLRTRVVNTDINGASSLNSLPKAHTVVLKLPRAIKKPQCSLPSLHIHPSSMFFCFPIEAFVGQVTCFLSMVGLPQLSVAAPWQSSVASFSARASQGITRAAWTVAGEFNSRLALVCGSHSDFPFSRLTVLFHQLRNAFFPPWLSLNAML